MIDLINRILNPIRTKIYMMIGHAILLAVENQSTKDGVTVTHPLQHVRIQGMAGENLTDVQRVQEYGLETYPAVGDGGTDGYPEAVAVFLNGDRENGLVICIGDRRYRITDLAEGEVALYTKWNEESEGHSIKLKSGQEIELNGITLDINVTNGVDISSDLNVTDEINTEDHYEVGGVQVVGTQAATITPSDGSQGGNTTAVNAVITALIAHGLIAGP